MPETTKTPNFDQASTGPTREKYFDECLTCIKPRCQPNAICGASMTRAKRELYWDSQGKINPYEKPLKGVK